MDSSVSPTFGEQEGSAYNGHFGCTCYHPLFVFNQFGDLERCALASRQRPLRRGLARGAGAGRRPLPDHDEAALLPSRCGVCLARGLRVPGSGGLRLCDPPARQCRPSTQDRSPAHASGGPSAPRGPALLRQLPLPGPDLEPLTPGRGQGRVASGRTLSPGRASWSRTCAARPSGWWPSTINAAQRSSGSERARTRSGGRACPAAR